MAPRRFPVKSKYEQRRYETKERKLFAELVAQNLQVLDEFAARRGAPETRALAVASGTHGRLGAQSWLRGLNADLLRLIVFEYALPHTLRRV